MLQAQWSREVSYIQRRVMNKWRFAVAEDRRLQHASQQIQRRCTSRQLWQAFTAWRTIAKRQHFRKQAVTNAVTRYTVQAASCVVYNARDCSVVAVAAVIVIGVVVLCLLSL